MFSSLDRKTVLIAIAVIALGAFAAACAPEVEEDPEDPAEPDEEYDVDATVVMARGTGVETLDIHNTTHVEATNTWSLMGDSLVAFDEDGNLVPLLAEDWEVGPEGLEYTFFLREDVTFHSGHELTAHDVEATFERWLTEEGSPTADDLGEVESIEAVDDYTFQLVLEEPNNAIWNILAARYGSIVNASNIEAEGDSWGTPAADHIDGTGPFELVDWRPDDVMVFERHDDYTWGPPEIYDNTGPAQIARLEYRVIPEDATRVEELLAGTVHLDQMVSRGDLVRIEQSDIINYIEATPASVEFLGFHCQREPFDDVLIRRALAHAINKQEIADVAYEGVSEPATSFLRPGMPGYSAEMAEFNREYDPAKAEELLDEAGWDETEDGVRMKDGEPLEFTLSAFDDEVRLTSAELYQAQAAQVGMDMELDVMESAAMFEHLRAEEHQMFTMGVTIGRRGPDVLRWYHHPDEQPAPNRFYYEDDELVDLLNLQRTTPDEDEQMQAYVEIERILMEDAAWVPVVWRDYIRGFNEQIADPKVDHPVYDGHFKLLDMRMAN